MDAIFSSRSIATAPFRRESIPHIRIFVARLNGAFAETTFNPEVMPTSNFLSRHDEDFSEIDSLNPIL
jgi:hypothetical protein